MGIFLKFGEVESDADDKNHKGWIACDSFTGGTTRPMYAAVGGGMIRNTSDAAVHEIGLRMRMHKGSPKIMMASVVGDACKAVIHVTRAGDTSGAQNYLEITLTDTYVTSYVVDCDEEMPMEMISLNFAKIEKKYTPNGPDGKGAGTPVPVGFDKGTGKKL